MAGVDATATPLMGSRRASTAFSCDMYSMANLLRLKPVQDLLKERTAEEKSDPEGVSLKKTLGIIDLIGYGVGCTVGGCPGAGRQGTCAAHLSRALISAQVPASTLSSAQGSRWQVRSGGLRNSVRPPTLRRPSHTPRTLPALFLLVGGCGLYFHRPLLL